jgi:hypothetical protein
MLEAGKPPMSPRRILVLALTLLACGCSQDAGAPKTPATSRAETASSEGEAGTGPDLSHVKVGQKYHFALEQAGAKTTMVWEVSAIAATEIRYTVTVRMNGAALGAPSESVWSVPRVKAPERTQATVETLSLAGRDWTCRVVVADGTKTWTAVSGDRETFPPLLKQTQGDVVGCVLVKIEG